MSKKSKGSRSTKLRLAHSGEPRKETPGVRRKGGVEPPQSLQDLCEQSIPVSATVRRPLTPGELSIIRKIFGPRAPIPKGVAVSPVNAVRAELDPEQPNGVWADILLKPNATSAEMIHEYAHWLAFWVLGPRALDLPKSVHEEWSGKVVEMHKHGQWFLTGHRDACRVHFLSALDPDRA